jgi:hypothetical protein
MKHIKLFEGYVDDHEKLYNKISHSPSEITIELTERGKELIEDLLHSWVEASRPAKQTGGYKPPTSIHIKDAVTISASYDNSVYNSRRTVVIGEIEIRGDYDSWVGISPLTKLLPNESGKESTTGYFQIFVEYYPLEDEAGTGASISILQGLRAWEKDQYRELHRGIYPNYRCDFDKVELDNVDNRGYFKIVAVKKTK